MQNLLVYGGGLLAFLPAVSQILWIFVTSLSDPEKASGMGVTLIIVTGVLSLIAVIAFAIHVWAGDNDYSGNEKVFWTLGMLFCFAPAIVPVYWYTTIFEPWHNKSNYDDYGRLGGSL